ncbi:probable polyamine transporter At1g31830 isoform X3 [Jatropha curcas]|uniref:probable polyamine transporter At1g31830 isoform X3 n=1 Tax=Jatropha curcas TaxID=180498 RepID=UPI001895E6B9|nr:probable polyamine transporter At1g31830 isoform X3 [Jatropha curcas]
MVEPNNAEYVVLGEASSPRGLTIVGWVAIILGVVSLLPFVVMGLVAIPKLEPSRWVVVDSGYFFPLLIGTGAVPLNRQQWSDGYFSDIAKIIGGVWLRLWIQGASALSNMGMFMAEMSSDSFQLLGMAERGMLPAFFAKRSRYGTPTAGILFSASGVILLSWLTFQEIVAAENFLYCFGMIMEFIAFVKLRIENPQITRPYKIPVGTVGAILICIPPTLLILVVLALASLKVIAISIIAVVLGLVMQPCLTYAESKRWFRFSYNSDLASFRSTYH